MSCCKIRHVILKMALNDRVNTLADEQNVEGEVCMSVEVEDYT